MIDLNLYNLSDAETAFAVANTPLFLLRKLRADQSISKLAQQASSQDILDELSKTLADSPSNLRDGTLPYIYIVALSMKADDDALDKAAAMDSPNHDWYKYIADVLKKTGTATTRVFYPLSSEIIAPRISTTSSVPATRLFLDFTPS